MKTTKTLFLAESGIMLSIATILSMVPIINLPYGGSVTAFSMLPIIIVAYRRGIKQGLFTALAFGLLQMLLGLNNLSYATSEWAAVTIIFLDYIAAFAVLGFGGIFRKHFESQAKGLVAGILLVCLLRYVAHVISGCTVWAGVSIPSADGLLFSLIYNATYMLPETLVTVVGALTLSRMVDIRGESIARTVPRSKAPDLALLFSGISKALLAAGIITDIVLVFSKIQNADTGEFDITQIAEVNWTLFIWVTALATMLALLFGALAKRVSANSSIKLGRLSLTLPVAGAVASAIFFVVNAALLLFKGAATPAEIIRVVISALVVLIFLVIIRRMRIHAK
ncbi:MAG: energy-coupled thiamine transporter ThiT [Oscillospiraceae bacterium]|nr:energy-coupled thiamine transporter ThiT [Oscillospiraceae bacterium]